MKKLIATIGIISALGIGAFALNSVLPASAGSLSTTQTGPAADPSAACGGPGARVKGVLDNLVANNTITQDQENAIIQAFKDERGNAPGPMARRGGPRAKVLGGLLDVAAGKIGVSVDELTTALKSGQSVADVATAHSVAPADVVTAIVDAGTTKVDQAVTDGKLTQAQADKIKAHLPDVADKFVNHVAKGC